MPATKNKMKCPVCDMEVDKSSKYKAEYKGQTYYFCSDSDEKEFQKRPHVYAGLQLHMSKTGKAA